ncbi:MAG: hypothetical protein QOE68_26 [Thermoanaerobaculia bacterium]|jgi:hypothetical protein|nr:hypothetical protein [Thermoanaerobaculia bacterium]
MSGAYGLAREGALDNPAPRSARGWGAVGKLRPRRRPPHDLAPREHFVVAASAATNFVLTRFPRAERGAGLSSAPPRAAAGVLRSPGLAISAAASCKSTDKSVCATLALPCSSIREYGRINVAQTLLSVLPMLGTIEKINATRRSRSCR